MQKEVEKLCLNWNEFRDNLCIAVGKLKEDTDFTDVTLVNEDGQLLQTHKLVLVSSSPFFSDILKRSRHPNPIIYMGGIKSSVLGAMIDFLYKGEVGVQQDLLEHFLQLAERLQLKDFRGMKNGEEELERKSQKDFRVVKADDEGESEVIPRKRKSDAQQSFNGIHFTQPEPVEFKSQEKDTKILRSSTRSSGSQSKLPEESNQTSGWLEELDQKVKSMFEFSENPAPGKTLGRARKCKVCGKEGERTQIINHIEANHMPGLLIPCQICGYVLTSRSGLKQHKAMKHK